MRFSVRVLLPSLLAALFLPSLSYPFADNIVRVDKFKWMRVQTAHFDIYYDSSTALMVPQMARTLENAWTDVGDKFLFDVPGRTPFFFYSDHNEFEQTNIVQIGEGTGGVTEAFKNRFLVFNDGTQHWLRHVIPHEFTHVVEFNILFGGFWKSVRLLKSPFFPLWMMEGMAEFGAGEIDAPAGDMVERDAVANNQLPALAELQGFGHLKPNQVTLGYKTGEAAINFLEDEYGKGRAHDLLMVMKDHFDVSSGLEEMLGCDLDRFNFRFHEWMHDRYAALLKHAKAPTTYGPRLTNGDGIPQFNEAPAVAPDGKKLYFLSDKGGFTQVYVYDFETARSRPLIPLKWMTYENIHSRDSSLSVSPDGRWLAFAGEKKQKDFLYLYDLNRGKLKKIKVPLEEIRWPAFSPVDSDRLVVAGMTRGFTDLYLINRRGEIIERLTDNPQAERAPVFSPDGQRIVYSGEMLDDVGEPVGWDLFELSVRQRSSRRITDLLGVESDPEVLPDGSILFVRDRNDQGEYGFNLSRLDPATGTVTPLTDFIGGGFTPTYSTARHELFYVGFYAGEKHIYRMDNLVVASRETATPAVDETLGDVPRAKSQAMARAADSWPRGGDSPLLTGPARPYRFQGSTDLFLPFFFYSTVDGLVIADIWRYSEMLGNHQFQQQMQYASGNDFLDMAMFYTYARFRPQFTIGFQNVKYYRDFDQQDQRRETTGVGLVTYPLDRVNTVSAGVGADDRRDTFLDDSELDGNFRERFYFAGIGHDTVSGRYLVPTNGRRVSLSYQEGVTAFAGDQKYKSGIFEASQYLPLPRESALAGRVFYGRSVGPQPQVFRLGGIDRIRALPSGSLSNKKSNVLFGSAEARLRIKYLNARTKFLFPDFFFKAAYFIAFDDIGYGWDNSTERRAFATDQADNSAGVGISWPTFLLQTFKIDFTILWAKRTDQGSEVWYISLGPSF